MLDDLKMIHERDAQDALGLSERVWQQLEHQFDVSQTPVDVDNIVFAGMGGSALAAALSNSWPGHTRPFQVVRDYDIPAYVSERTYFVAASYSGNTEETLSALEQAEAKGAKIAIITSGGKLAEAAKAKGYPLALLPKISEPRYGVLYNLRALLTLLEAAGLVQGAVAELEAQTDFVKKAVEAWVPTVPTAKNSAKQLAQEVIGKSAVIYAGPKLGPLAYYWKISFNENAKQVAWANQLPEFNHNEFIGWTKQPTHKPYAVIELRSSLEHERVQKRFKISERLLSGMRPAPIVIEPQGETILQQLLWSLAFGSFTTLYTAILNGLNPTPVELVEKFKQQMEESNE